ncbi:NAD(P)-binding protein [Thozetella sp. PMI_491]|nr:NAD(P)-binding protein [Thozetella sp. PMI_491]
MPAMSGFVNWTAEKDLPSFKGKVLFVTGATAGLGRESVLALAKRNPDHIYFTGRNAKAGASLIEAVGKIDPAVGVTFLELDMTSLPSVKSAMAKFTHDRLDILMCNAGIMAAPPELTKDGFELQFGVNHLAHAMIIDQLLPVLQRTADLPNSDVRIISLTSEGWSGHPAGGVIFDKLRTPMEMFFGSWIRYGQSKFANIVYAAELARRYPKILAVSVHPGVVSTGLVTNLNPVKKSFVHVSNLFLGRFLMEPEQGAYSQLWLTGVERDKIVPGGYYKPIGVLSKTDKTAESPEVAAKLWEWTHEALAGF